MRLPRDVEYIIERLESFGHRADIVGGPVRDFLLGRSPEDYDITTDATPDRVKAVFSGDRTVDTGIKHGTVSLILRGIFYEITTYRVDGEYKDSRHPDSVSFTDKLSDDLARRDFTMNAVCYNPRDGFTDPYGGRDDISERIIRAVGDPEKRFSEDALRILRAIRFASVLGFEIESTTRQAVFDKKDLLTKVSAERIYTEWKKLLSGKFAYSVIEEFSSVISVFLPKLSEPNLPSAHLFSEADYLSRMLSVFSLTLGDGAPSAYDSAMKTLKTDRAVRETGISVLSSLKKFDLSTDVGLKCALMRLGEDNARALVRLEYTLGNTEKNTEARLNSLLSSGTPYRISDLRIGGTELMRLGIEGKRIGECLTRLLSLVVEDRILNESEALIAEAQKINRQL